MILPLLLALVAAEPAVPPKEPPVSDDRSPGHSPDFAKPRDGDIAIREEFEAAARANTVAAWTLFIERHPGHPLIPAAERERRKLLQEKP